jgi:hypothetical protein
VLRPFASIRLTVVLLAMSIFLVFAGTWAQIDMGIWSTLKVYFRSVFVQIPLQIFLPRDWNVQGWIPFPGGYLLGWALMINLLAAHATRFKWSRSRAGIFLIHLGLVLLLVGEFVTAMFAKEANMTIDEGQTINYAEDIRTVELAITDPSDPQQDRVVVIPESRLLKGGRISVPSMPFELEVLAYYLNSDFVDLDKMPPNAVIADHGTAARYAITAIPRPVASGVDQNSTDLPVVFVRVLHDGEPVGTWMAGLYFSLISEPEAERVEVAGQPYWMSLRFKREYKPYSIKLIDFRHDRYLGTDMPRNYSSQIQLIDPEHNENREVLIYMNNPLRYRGETFYQASFKKGDTGTVLQVVRNPGWLLPYIACTVGAIGMLMHFGMSLSRFLKRRFAS